MDVYGNLKEEYKTELGLAVASRTASYDGPIFKLADNNPKKRKVWVTVISGTIASGTHRIKLLHSSNGSTFTEADSSGDITTASTQDGIVTVFGHQRVKQ